MELLAPAGTYECVVAAVNSGADAVYFAGKDFGARSFAGNLTTDEIQKAVEYCRLRNVKAYVTVNTLVYDREFKALEEYIKVLTNVGVDAVIVQDLGVLKTVREMSPDIELHASTQMTVHSSDGVRELEKLGVSRVVLSRELSESEIADIINETNAEIEIFVHGAMCMSYSGQCLMSSVIGGRSGNRGKCAQPCRLLYSKDGIDKKHYLSLKDMSLANHINTLSKIGVSSLKIEGRMKGAEYVSRVVSVYRRLIDENRVATDKEIQSMNSIFYRGGLTDGYFVGKTGPSMFAFDKPDNPYLKNDEKTIIPKNRQSAVKFSAELEIGKLPCLTVNYGDICETVCGNDVVEKAKNKPTDKEAVIKQLNKTGDTPFFAESISVNLSDNAFVPIATLNELRRNAVEMLENRILSEKSKKRFSKFSELKTMKKSDRECCYTCSVATVEQYREIKKFDFEYIYAELCEIEKHIDEFSNDKRVVVTLPVIIKGNERNNIKNSLSKLKECGFDKVEISTLDAVGLCDGFEIFSNYHLNLTNLRSVNEIYSMGIKNICLSSELNTAQIRDIAKYADCEAVVYGRIAVMVCENCIIKNTDNCPCTGKYTEIIDRTGRKLPVSKDGDICRSVVYNSCPLYMGDKLNELKGVRRHRLIFTTESDKECAEVISAYKNGEKPWFEFTRLHMNKGAD